MQTRFLLDRSEVDPLCAAITDAPVDSFSAEEERSLSDVIEERSAEIRAGWHEAERERRMNSHVRVPWRMQRPRLWVDDEYVIA